MSQQIAQQATRIREEKSIATKEFHVAIEIAKDSKKSYRDRVDRLKRKMSVTTRKIMSRHILDAEGLEKLIANRFGVATQGTPIATRMRLLHQNSVMTLSKYVVTKSKKELRNQVTTENNRLR